MKKRIFLIIIAIAITILTAFISNKVYSENYDKSGYITDFNHLDWGIGEFVGLNRFGKTTSKGDTYADGFQVRENKNFFCTEKGQDFDSGKYRLVAKIKISGDDIESAEVVKPSTITDANLTIDKIKYNTNENAKIANRILTKIVKDAKEKIGQTYEIDGKTYSYRNRNTPSGKDMWMGMDVYQRMMWKYLPDWKKAVFGPDANTVNPLDYYIASTNSTLNTENSDEENVEEKAKAELTSIKNSSATTPSTATISNKSKIESLETSNIDGKYTILGPFKFEYGGTISQFDIYFDDDKDKLVTDREIGEYEGEAWKKITAIKNLPSNSDFYIKVPTTALEDKTKLNIYAKVQGDDKIQTYINIFVNASNPEEQSIMYVDQEIKPTEDYITAPYVLITKKDVSIQKQDKDGNNLAVEGIKFEIYDANNKLGTLSTDANGKTESIELHVNRQYKIVEVENKAYGYKAGALTDATITNGSIEKIGKNELTFKITGDSIISIKNTQNLGKIELKKYDEDNHNITLKDVGFVLGIMPSPDKKYTYITLYNQNGEMVTSVRDNITINSKNVANANEYKLGYYHTEHTYAELTDAEKEKITTFITGDDGILTINNLEVYSSKDKKYTYKLIETTNSNYGYIVDKIEIGDIILEANTTTSKVLGNESKYTKISGYVWLENSAGKTNEYDGLYTVSNTSTDVKLTNLYVEKDGKLVKNEKATIPVEIKLRDKTTGEIIKELPDQFAEDGEYTFVDVEIEKLENYEVVFVYDGFYYTTIVPKLDQANGSKVKEVASERATLSNKFETIKDNSEVVTTDGTTNKVEYIKDGHTSTVSELKFDTTITANTGETGYNLKEEYNKLKANATIPVEGIENINMGIVLREQPKLSINSDIHSAQVSFEGYTYNYKYNGRQNYYENKNGDEIGVKFEEEYATQRYTRTVFASDVQAAKDQGKDIDVSIIYKIQIANESRTLSVMPKTLINYFDANYEIQAVGLGLDENGTAIPEEKKLAYTEASAVEGMPEYKSTVISFNQTIEASNDNVKTLYIKFDVSREAILGLLDGSSTYHNATEILSYASYYGEGTSKINGEQFITDVTEKGSLYAGIDKMSQPGNAELKLINHPSGDGTQILDTTNFEDDTTSAPSLILEAQESRIISGTIWEDIDANTTDNEKIGDGIYNEGEKHIEGVTVELHEVKEDVTIIATYSDGTPVQAVTDENGNYTFGYCNEADKKYVGVLPGKYVIKYIYNNESYIVGKENITVNDYKSTIITSEVVKNAFEGIGERWYLTDEGHRYSDARDDINLRPEHNEAYKDMTVTNSTYNNVLNVETMNAYTPIMDIGLEFTELDEADALTFEFIKELGNVDFGIIERPDIDITIDKKITSLEIVSQTGASIIPKGDPTNVNDRMQYVKNLPGLISVEMEADLLHGAKLNLEYTITIENNSQKDYLEKEYYYYGTGGRTEAEARAKTVVDYLDSSMELDTEKNEGIWTKVTSDDLYKDKDEEGIGFITEDVYKTLNTAEYHILTTNAFEEVGSEDGPKSVKLYAIKYLAVDDSIREENKVEIIELTGKRTIKESIPGNYVPTESPSEVDEDEVVLVITPPTGTTTNYVAYIIAIVATFAILVLGVVIIKKKIIK